MRILVGYEDPTTCESMEIALDPAGHVSIQVGDTSSVVEGPGDHDEAILATIPLSGAI